MTSYVTRGECLNAVALYGGKIRGLRTDLKLLQAEVDRQSVEIDRLRETVAVMREHIARLEGLHGKGGRQWTSSER